VTGNYDIALVVGTRPNFVKAAPFLNKLEEQNKKVLFIHTGQHFDKNMSKNIFDDLSIRVPDINLNAPSDSQSKQFQYIVEELQKIFKNCKIDKVGVFGDVTSTLAASIAAKQSDLYLFHVESGLRSNNLGMPEERNRIMVDAISDLLLVPSEDAEENLLKERVSLDKIHNVGNIMIDTLLKNKSKIINNSEHIKDTLNIDKPYFVMTLHRPSNLNDETLKDIFEAISNFTQDYQVILPAHPRLKYYIDDKNIELRNIVLIEPLSYIDFMSLVYGCDLVLTDSGGIQEETTFLGINCLTLREETERPITVQEGTNKVIGTDKENIINEINNVLGSKISKIEFFKFYLVRYE
jgi:UDP-N-acetylglucosamine 2-epimerase (non-hydrolysing)